MSALSEKQKLRIEENRQKALALRAAKSAGSTHIAGSGGNATQGTSNRTHPLQSPTSKSRASSCFVQSNSSAKSNNVTTPTKSGSSTKPLFTSYSPKKPDLPCWLGVNSGSSALVSTSSSTVASSVKSFYSNSNNNKTISSSSKASPSKTSNFCSPKKFYDAGTNYNSKFGKKESQVTGKCILQTRDRFLVDVGYSAGLIEVFKTMKTREYDMQTKKWSFALSEYRDLLHKMSDVACIAPLPRCVITAFSSMIQDRPQEETPPLADLSHVSKDLVDQLLPFQRHGVNFAVMHGGRLLIADDMGLGKTIQALCVCAYYRQAWPLLIVVPSSLRFAWREQILRFLPEVDPQEINIVVTGKDNATCGQINIISYDLMVRRQKELETKGFRIIVMDESHFLKNNKTARTKTAVPLLRRARHVILLSGTPALSRPAELYPQVSVVDPQLFPKFHEFGVRYCAGKQMPWGWDYSGSSHLEELQLVLEQRVMIRRLKKDVLSQLPAKIRQMVVLDSSSVKINSTMKNSHKYINKAKGSDRRGALLEYFHDTAEAKIPAVRQYVLDLLESGNKFLVFAHHQTVLDALEEAIGQKFGYIRIDGSTLAEQRNLHVRTFQNQDTVKVALLSITAANAGLNLTAASLVVFTELFWNPGILVQAEDRAHRIGQHDSVSVHYLVATGTADDFIWPLVKQKLEVLGRAGLSKEDFAQADTKHVKDPKQNSLLKYFEESFFDYSSIITESSGTLETDNNDEKGNKPGPSGLFQYFQPKERGGESANHCHQYSSANSNSADKPKNEEDMANQATDDMDYSWLDDDFDEEDPEAPWPKKPKINLQDF